MDTTGTRLLGREEAPQYQRAGDIKLREAAEPPDVPTDVREETTPLSQGQTVSGSFALSNSGLDLLFGDHEAFRQLFGEYEQLVQNAGGSPDAKDRKLAIAQRLVQGISQHSSMEERYLYPLAYSELEEGRTVRDAHIVDHMVLKQLLDYIDSHEPTSAHEWKLFDAMMLRAKGEAEGHFTMEENEIFAPLRYKLSPDSLSRLAADLRGAARDAPLKPHPGAPTSGVGARLVHPVTGALDRISQAVRGNNETNAPYSQPMYE